MKAVVMAGGEGSRLRPLTSRQPKPLVPVAGRPIMEHILLHLRRHQMRDVIATVQYLGASIRNYFGDGSEQGVALTYSVEDSPLGTAGSVMLARQQLNEPFLVISGDALTDIDLGAAVRFHRERRALATIVLKPVPNPLEYGVVVVDDGGAVQKFIEKPSWGEVISDLANTGIYVLDPAVFDFFRPGEPTDWSGDVFPKLLKQGEPVFGWVTSGYWEDVGINIVGFIPLGFFSVAYFSTARAGRHAVAMAILLGFLTSLAIEVLQAYLPTRDSGINDLVTNTCGTGLGVLLYRSSSFQRFVTKATLINGRFRLRSRGTMETGTPISS